MIIPRETISLDDAITLVMTDEWKWGDDFGVALLSEAQKEMTEEQESIWIQTYSDKLKDQLILASSAFEETLSCCWTASSAVF